MNAAPHVTLLCAWHLISIINRSDRISKSKFNSAQVWRIIHSIGFEMIVQCLQNRMESGPGQEIHILVCALKFQMDRILCLVFPFSREWIGDFGCLVENFHATRQHCAHYLMRLHAVSSIPSINNNCRRPIVHQPAGDLHANVCQWRRESKRQYNI